MSSSTSIPSLVKVSRSACAISGSSADGDLLATFDHGYRGPEAAQGLREFEANVTSAEYDHVFRQTVEIESFDVSHRFCSRKTGNIGNRSTRSEIEKDPFTCESSAGPLR